MVETTSDRFLDGAVHILQPKAHHHRAGLDAVLLAASVPADVVGAVADLGAGVGTAGLCLAQRLPHLSVTLVERDATLVELAHRNAVPFGSRVHVIMADLLLPAKQREAAGLVPASADIILANPPFHPAGRIRPSPDQPKADAYILGAEEHLGWVKAAAHLGRGKAQLYLIIRADDISAWLTALQGRFGGVEITPLHPKAELPATRLLLRAIKGSKAPLQLWPGLALHGADGTYCAPIQSALSGAALAAFPQI